MIDSYIHEKLNPYLESFREKISQSGWRGQKLEAAGFAIGFLGCVLTGLGLYLPALALFLLQRTLSTVAGESRFSLLVDFTIFSAFIFFFLLSAPAHGIAAALLLVSFIVMSLTYVAHGEAAKNEKGIVEYSEMMIFIALCCIYPPGFSAYAAFFALLCFVTAFLRLLKITRA